MASNSGCECDRGNPDHQGRETSLGRGRLALPDQLGGRRGLLCKPLERVGDSGSRPVAEPERGSGKPAVLGEPRLDGIGNLTHRHPGLCVANGRSQRQGRHTVERLSEGTTQRRTGT